VDGSQGLILVLARAASRPAALQNSLGGSGFYKPTADKASWPGGALAARISLRFADAVSVAARKIARQRRFPFRVPYNDAINAVTGGPSGHPI
jgi:hypothetical protein